jgi:heme oxygenase
MVAAMHDFHQRVDVAVTPWTGAVAAEGLALTSRAPALRAALAALDGPVHPVPVGHAAVSLGEALGWLYVAEGSMLGGRVMKKAMTRDGVDQTGLDFLDPWGHETGSRWQTLIAAMESACGSGRAASGDIVKGGVDAFSLAYRLLTATRPIEKTA